jgi:hypothetical protein
MPIPDPRMEKFGSGMEKIRIRDKHHGFATLESRMKVQGNTFGISSKILAKFLIIRLEIRV